MNTLIFENFEICRIVFKFKKLLEMYSGLKFLLFKTLFFIEFLPSFLFRTWRILAPIHGHRVGEVGVTPWGGSTPTPIYMYHIYYLKYNMYQCYLFMLIVASYISGCPLSITIIYYTTVHWRLQREATGAQAPAPK